MSRKEHSFLSIILKSQIFILPKIGRDKGNEIRFNKFFTKTLKISIYIQPFILKWKSNNNIVIKWFYSFPSMLLTNKVIYIPLIFIHFYYFILKHSNKVT